MTDLNHRPTLYLVEVAETDGTGKRTILGRGFAHGEDELQDIVADWQGDDDDLFLHLAPDSRIDIEVASLLDPVVVPDRTIIIKPSEATHDP